MNLILFKIHCGNTQGKCNDEVYFNMHESTLFFATTQSELIFQQALSKQKIMNSMLSKNHSGYVAASQQPE